MERFPIPQVASPCIRVCCLDDEDICIGCGRTLTEICEWSVSTDERRLQIAESARTRLDTLKRQRGED